MRFTMKVSFPYSEYMKIFYLLHQQEIERVSTLSKMWGYNLNRAPQRTLLANNEVAADKSAEATRFANGLLFLDMWA